MKKLLLGTIASFVLFSVCIAGDTSVCVREFGATGDGKADDTGAFQNAIDAACPKTFPAFDPTKPRVVVIPPGLYRITKPLKIEKQHRNLVLLGTGGSWGGFKKGVPRAVTMLQWDGEKGGILMDVWANMGLRISDIYFHGNEKAGILLRINSWEKRHGKPQAASAQQFLERVQFTHAERGIVIGDDSYICSSDMTFIDVAIDHCKTGFQTLSDQNLNYTFIRPQVGFSGTAFHFKRGGSVVMIMPSGGRCDTFIRIGSGGINTGTFSIIGMRAEPWNKGKRASVFLEARGQVNVKFTGLITTCMGKSEKYSETPGYKTPAFILSDGARVSVDSSMVCGRIARMKGVSGRPTWIQFDNCRFDYTDLEKDIVSDEYSGYELRNCTVTNSKGKTIHIRNKAKYPKQTEQ